MNARTIELYRRYAAACQRDAAHASAWMRGRIHLGRFDVRELKDDQAYVANLYAIARAAAAKVVQ